MFISGNDSDIKNVVEKSPELVNSRDAHFGRTPLMYCILADRLDAAKYLLALPNLDVNIADKAGRTALHVAAHKSNLAMLQLLHSSGVDLKCAQFKPIRCAFLLDIQELGCPKC